MLRLVLATVVALLASQGSAQSGLQIHAAVVPGADGDTRGMRQLDILSRPGEQAWVGEVVLDLPPSSIRTVGLEVDPDGTAALSVWLTTGASRALQDLTGASVGRALAVLHDGRTLVVPVIRGEVTNGHVQITGLNAADGRRLARILRAENGGEGAPPSFTRPEPVAPSMAGGAPRDPQPESMAEAVAVAFAHAISRRDWGTAADALHPDARAALRRDALSILQVTGRTVEVSDGPRRGSFPLADVLGTSTRGLDELTDRDLAALHLAALDVLGAWGRPGSARQVVGRVRDGDRVHVLLGDEARASGLSAVATITLQADPAGLWRPLLPGSRGF